MFTVMDLLAIDINKTRGIAINRLTGEHYYFHFAQVKRADQGLLSEGCPILVSPDGYIEDATASFKRLEVTLETN